MTISLFPEIVKKTPGSAKFIHIVTKLVYSCSGDGDYLLFNQYLPDLQSRHEFQKNLICL